MADSFNTPNVVIPLAMSYDTRYVASRTAMQSGIDQRKVNVFYDVIRNSVTGNTTLELVKRPGIYRSSLGTSVGGTPVKYNIIQNGNAATWFSTRGGAGGTKNYVSNGSADTEVLDDGNYVPYILSSVAISGVPTGVMQYRRDTATSAHRVFYASTIGSWTEISDSVFTGLYHRGKMEFVDGFALILDSTGKIYSSSLNTLAIWPATSFISRNSLSDTPRGLARFKGQILAFGDSTVEVFYNAGNPSGSPLSRITNSAEQIGMGNTAREGTYGLGRTEYYSVLGGRMYFIGRDKGGSGDESLFTYNGQSFEKIYSGPLNRVLGEFASGTTEPPLYSVSTFSFQGKSAIAIQLTAPGATTQKWLMFFPELQEWFEWESTVFSPINAGGIFLSTGGSLGEKLFTFSPVDGTSVNDWRDDYGNTNVAITSTVQFRLPTGGNNRKFMRWCGLEADTTTSASNVTVKFSDDDYQNFDSGRTIDLNTDKKALYRCGSYRNRVVRLEHSANAEFRARKFLARVE